MLSWARNKSTQDPNTELPTATQLDVSLEKVDTGFVDTCTKFLKDLPNLKNMKPFPKALVPEGNTTLGIDSMAMEASLRNLEHQYPWKQGPSPERENLRQNPVKD